MQNRIKFISILIVSILISTYISAQSYSTKDYISKYSDLAVKEMKRVGIPASITLAQGILESASGNSTLSKKSNNHFGIKCHDDWHGRKVYFDDDKRGECFRKYPKVYDSYIDHSNFLTTKRRYASLFKLKITNYKGWAHGLKKAGYATDPRYAHRLIKLIEDYKLYRFDNKKYKAKELATSTKDNVKTSGLTVEAFKTHKIERNNGVRYVMVQDGDTYASICEEFGLKEWEIYTYNDLEKGEPISNNRYLYLSSKRRKAHRGYSTCIIKKGETLHYLSQKYGVKLRLIYKYNNMNSGDKPNVGDVINLRKRKK